MKLFLMGYFLIQIPLGLFVGRFIATGMGDGDHRRKIRAIAWKCYP